jgi:hypothetical protein
MKILSLRPKWKATKRNYELAKEITLLWGQLNYVLDLYIAYLFGSEQFVLAICLLIVDLVLGYIDNHVYLWVLEQMGKQKVAYGKRNGNGSSSKNK